MTVVRQAAPADEPALLDLLIEVHRQGLGKAFPYDTQKVKDAIQLGTRRNGGYIAVVDAPDRPGVIAGSMCFLVTDWWWSRCCLMQMRWLFVRPEYRFGRDYAAALMSHAEECREIMQRGIEYPMVLESSFVNGDARKVKIMERWWGRWGKKVGGVYLSGMW